MEPSAAARHPAPSTAATVDVVFELSRLLECGLDRRQVQICMALIDAGVHPTALAAAVQELRRKALEAGLQRGAAAAGPGQQQ